MNRPGIWPLCEPPVAVATSRPVACFSPDEAPTALLPSTAPALRAKLTAATADPVLAITSATIEITSEGEGFRILIPCSSPRACLAPLTRRRAKVAGSLRRDMGLPDWLDP